MKTLADAAYQAEIVERLSRAGAAAVAMPPGIAEIVRRFCGASADELATGHPMLGRMTSGDWMRWGYLHTDHHLRQFGR